MNKNKTNRKTRLKKPMNHVPAKRKSIKNKLAWSSLKLGILAALSPIAVSDSQAAANIVWGTAVRSRHQSHSQTAQQKQIRIESSVKKSK